MRSLPSVIQHPTAGYCRYHHIWLNEQKIIEKDCINRTQRQLLGYCPYFDAGAVRTVEKFREVAR